MTDEITNIDQSKSEKPKATKRTEAIIGITLLAVIAFCGIAISIPWAKEDPEPVSVEDRAINMCQDAVLQVLKAPATADFVDTPTASSDGSQIRPVYTVIGNVDAENSFGALIRSTYMCEIQTSKGEDSWSLESVDVVLPQSLVIHLDGRRCASRAAGRGGQGIDFVGPDINLVARCELADLCIGPHPHIVLGHLGFGHLR